MDMRMRPYSYSLGLGAIYLALGLLELLAWATGRAWAIVPPDPFGGFVLLVVGGIFLIGAREPGGLLVGATLALGLGGLYLLVLGADYLSYLIGDLEGWRPLSDLRPEIWLAPLALPGVRAFQGLQHRGFS